jgi:hypothetical protein
MNTFLANDCRFKPFGDDIKITPATLVPAKGNMPEYCDIRGAILGGMLHWRPAANRNGQWRPDCKLERGMKSPRRIFFEKASDVPNSKLPVLVFRGALSLTTPAKARRFREAFTRNGWAGIWTDTIYDYTHFHSNAHEVLGIAEGKVTIILGGAEGRRFRLKKRYARDSCRRGSSPHWRRRRPQGDRRVPVRSISLQHETKRPGSAVRAGPRHRPSLRSGWAADTMLDYMILTIEHLRADSQTSCRSCDSFG